MRVLDPQVAQERKRSLLQWIIHQFIQTSKPVSSQAIAKEGGFKLSSATIRNILQELEEEGFLQQPHTSAGRVPTDKGYRFYVDYLMEVQRLASEEKERISRQYQRQVDELDQLLAQASRTLSSLSHSGGFVLSPRADDHRIKRLEIMPMGKSGLLVLVVTHSGLIRHWPLKLSVEPTPGRIAALNRFLNHNAEGKSLRDVRTTLLAQVEEAEREIREMSALAKDILHEVASLELPDPLYLDGASNVLGAATEPGDLDQLRKTIRLLEEKQRFAQLLKRQMDEAARLPAHGKARVRIGAEIHVPELKGLSLVSTTYEMKDQAIGMLGIVGPKRMEYSKMVALVEFMSGVVSRTLDRWETIWQEDERGRTEGR